MPRMSGLKVCADLKMDTKTKNIPVFMLTAKAQVRDIDAAMDVGADDYITKPFNPKEIANKIKLKLG